MIFHSWPLKICLFVGFEVAGAVVSKFRTPVRALLETQSAAAAEVENVWFADGADGAFDFALHGQDWKEGLCTRTQGQSPVDLPPAAQAAGSFTYAYPKWQKPLTLRNDGNALSLDLLDLGGGVYYNGFWYPLLSMTAKAGSEHTFGGVRKALELHLIHKRHDNGDILILAVPVDCATPPGASSPAPAPALASSQVPSPAPMPMGAVLMSRRVAVSADQPMQVNTATLPLPYKPPATDEPDFNPALQAFLNVPPPAPRGEAIAPVSQAEPLDLVSLITSATSGPLSDAAPASATAFIAHNDSTGVPFYTYNGSLTVPPCADNVAWFVRQEAITASDSQVASIHEALFRLSGGSGNYRSIQPTGMRPVNIALAVADASATAPSPSAQLMQPPPRSDTTEREMRTREKAARAMRITKTAVDWASRLDRSIRKASSKLDDTMSKWH